MQRFLLAALCTLASCSVPKDAQIRGEDAVFDRIAPDRSIPFSKVPEAKALAGPFDVVRVSSGATFVLDLGANDVYQFDANNQFVRTVGRQGAGPGEYIRANRLSLMLGDSVLLWDVSAGRSLVFDKNGEYVRSFAAPVGSAAGALTLLGSVQGGRVATLDRPMRAFGSNDLDLSVDSSNVHLLSGGSASTVIARVPSGARLIVKFSGGSSQSLPVPDGQNRIMSACTNGIIVFGGDSLHVISLSGSRMLSRAAFWPRKLVIGADRSTMIESVVKFLPVPAARVAVSRRLESIVSPEIWSSLAPRITSDGRLWFRSRREDHVVRRYDVDGVADMAVVLPDSVVLVGAFASSLIAMRPQSDSTDAKLIELTLPNRGVAVRKSGPHALEGCSSGVPF